MGKSLIQFLKYYTLDSPIKLNNLIALTNVT